MPRRWRARATECRTSRRETTDPWISALESTGRGPQPRMRRTQRRRNLWIPHASLSPALAAGERKGKEGILHGPGCPAGEEPQIHGTEDFNPPNPRNRGFRSLESTELLGSPRGEIHRIVDVSIWTPQNIGFGPVPPELRLMMREGIPPRYALPDHHRSSPGVRTPMLLRSLEPVPAAAGRKLTRTLPVWSHRQPELCLRRYRTAPATCPAPPRW